MSKKISPEEYWKWDKFEGETSADTFEALFPTQHKKYDTSKVKTITLNGKKYIDMSVIEDIKAEIEKAYKHQRIVKGTEWTNGLLCAVDIIDKAVKGEEK